MRSKRKASSRPCVPQCKERVMEIDLPEVVAEVTAEFERYEKALVSNDVAILDAIFPKDPRTIRYGGSETSFRYIENRALPAPPPTGGCGPPSPQTGSDSFSHESPLASTAHPPSILTGKT